MGDSLLLILVFNSLVFSFIFWLLTFAAKYFYQDKYSNYKLNFYECGFKSISKLRLNFSIQFVLLAAFLIIYDSEFLMLFPIAFNFFYVEPYQYFVFLVFMLFLLVALFIDYVYSALDWTL